MTMKKMRRVEVAVVDAASRDAEPMTARDTRRFVHGEIRAALPRESASVVDDDDLDAKRRIVM